METTRRRRDGQRSRRVEGAVKQSDFVGAFVTTVAKGDTDEFADLRAGPDGIGRIRALHGTVAEVEYFLSPAGPRLLTKQVDLMELKRVLLRPQTVVFWQDPVSDAWRRGRVTAADTTNVPPAEELYRVQFPND